MDEELNQRWGAYRKREPGLVTKKLWVTQERFSL